MTTMDGSARRWCSVYDSGHVTLALQVTPPHLINSAARTTPPGIIPPLLLTATVNCTSGEFSPGTDSMW